MADFDYNNEFVEDRYSMTADELAKVTGRSGTGNSGITNILSEHKKPGPYNSPALISDQSGLKSKADALGEISDSAINAATAIKSKGGNNGGFDDNNEFVETHYA